MNGTVPRVPFALGPLPFEFLVTWVPTSTRRAWVPSKAHTNTGRLCSAGSANPFPDVLARMQPSDSLPPVGRGSGRPWPVAYPVPRATRRKKGLPGAWAVLFQRAVGSDPAGCASRLAHRVETAIAFRLHNTLGTQNERYFVAVNPTAHSLACLRIGDFVTADAARLATGVDGSPFTGRVSHPLDGEQSFMTSPHRHSPLTSLAWSHHAPTPADSGPDPTI